MSEMNGVLKENKVAEELLKRYDIADSPFMVISIEDKNEHFGVMGKFRLTEKFETFDEAHDATSQMNWNKITQVTALICQELIENQEKINSIINKKEKNEN